MDVTLTEDLTAAKAAALAAIDASAERLRGNWITLGAGQSMVYLEKRREAEMVSANPQIPEAEVPSIAAEAAHDRVSLLDKAAEVLTQAYAWSQVSALIEVRRLGAKAAVDAATHAQEIAAAARIDWSDITAQAPQEAS
ncbi:MAG: hypothetical protein ACTHJ3_07740 [Pararhizobium sp.]